jgi:hypothetical protein
LHGREILAPDKVAAAFALPGITNLVIGCFSGGAALQRQPRVPQTLYCCERWPGRKGPSWANSVLIWAIRRPMAAAARAITGPV